MAAIHVILEGEEAVFSWKDGKVYTEGYDLESEKAVLALTGFGKGVGVLLVAINNCCESEAEFMREVEMFVAGHKEIPTDRYGEWPDGQLLFEYLSYSSDFDIRWRGVFDARLSDRHYKRMLGDPDINIKIRMARIPELPEKYFYPLLNHSNSDVNYYMALNEHCPIDVLEILSSNKDAEVRGGVAQNKKCPGEILELLAQDKYGSIRWRVAQNIKCPQWILKILARDTKQMVREAARENLVGSKGIEV